MSWFRKLTSLLALLLSQKIYSAGQQQQFSDEQDNGNLMEVAPPQPFVQDENKKEPANIIPRGQLPATFTLNGTTYKLNVNICNGGVMLKEKIPVDEFCGVGEFYVRPTGCIAENEMFVGARNEYTCSTFSSGVQAFLKARNIGEVDKAPRTETTVQEILTNSSSEDVQSIMEDFTTEASFVQPSYLDSVEQNNSTDFLFEHNSLMEKRGASVRGHFDEDELTLKTSAEDQKFPVEETTELDLMEIRNIRKRSGVSEEEEDTLPLDAPEAGYNSGGLGGRSDFVRPSDAQAIDFEIVEGSYEDTLPIVSPRKQLSVIDSVLNGKPEDLRNSKGIVAGNFPMTSEEEFSSEMDERGGKWEGDVQSLLPAVGTLERDVLTGGFDKWVGMASPSPLFDTHVSLLKRQIEFELVQGGTHDGNQSGVEKMSHDSVVGRKDVAYNTTWYALLTEVTTTASALVPEKLFRNPFSALKNNSVEGSAEFSNIFFADALRIFGYFTRSYDGDGVEIKDSLLDAIRLGFQECRKRAEEFKRGCVVGGSGTRGTDCVEAVELKSIKVTQPVWNEYNATYANVSRTLDFSSSSDNLPPLHARINPSKWIFAELMWYAVQITHMFCFDSFSGLYPNAFMIAYDVMLRLFQSELVTELWDEVGGNLGVFELILPYIRRGLVGTAEPGDFRNLLTQLDKLAGGIRATTVIGEFGRRKKLTERRRSDWEEVSGRRRRRRRDVEGESDASRDSLSDVGGEAAVNVNTDLMSDFEGGETVRSNTDLSEDSGDVNVDANSLPNQENKVFSQSGWYSTTQKSIAQVITDVNVTEFESSDAKNSTYSNIMEALGYQNAEVDPDTIFATGEAMTSTTTRASTTTTNPTTFALKIPNSEPTTESTAATPSSMISTSRVYEDTISQYEIWDGLAYCLVTDEFANVSPSFDELQQAGVCG